ncbi:hypothetical protein HOLleu_00029 [Holothuria leucospilota]|uniref:DUF5641 domain-containing protein n=1 Tax=Holothuria leucospilota TaxID=206669 RepID=A0A9Q1CMF4_HOLLE|nr:hypothetical protein HOLleu_00029 [Holothuria leucospilota]
MIRTTRGILNSLLFQHKGLLNDETLTTFMAEAETIINSRPLAASNEASEEPLTPAHLLTLKNSVVQPPPGNFIHNDKFSKKLWRRVQYLAEVFWCRWKKEYINYLQSRQKWTRKGRNLQIGDIVLLCEEGVPRNRWEMCKVVKVYPSDDGLIRKVSVFIGRRKSTLDRPITKLVLLIPVVKN